MWSTMPAHFDYNIKYKRIRGVFSTVFHVTKLRKCVIVCLYYIHLYYFGDYLFVMVLLVDIIRIILDLSYVVCTWNVFLNT